MDTKTEVKKCPKCEFVNKGTARFCSNRDCDFIFPMPQPTSKPQPAVNPVSEFQSFTRKINDAIKTVIAQGIKSIKSINHASTDDNEMKKAYTVYVSNFETAINTLDQVKAMTDSLQTTYNEYQTKLPAIDSSSIELLELLYQKAYDNTIEAVRELITTFSDIKPFNRFKSYLLSPTTEWDDTFDHDNLTSSFLYLGIIRKNYEVLGQQFQIERREYIELLHANNLVIRYNKATEKLCLDLVATIIGRMLNKCPLSLPICVIDHDRLGIHERYRYLPDSMYCVEPSFDAEEIKELEGIRMRHEDSTNDQIIVFKDWYACEDHLGDQDQLRSIMEKGVDTGLCFITLINKDSKPLHASAETDGDMISIPGRQIELDFTLKRGDFIHDYDLMNENLIEKTCRLVQTLDDITEQSADIDINELFRNRNEQRIGKLKLTLYIGKDNQLNDKAIELRNDGIHSSLLVQYDQYSHVFPWVKAMIAQAFKYYGSQQLNVMLADFVDCEELSEIHSIDSKQAPFFYFRHKTNINSTKDKVLLAMEQFLREDSGKRMLVFLVGKYEYLKDNFIITKYHNKKNLHLVMLVTDIPNEVAWNGFQLEFGPKRIENGNEINEDEFVYMDGEIYHAYSCDDETLHQLIKDYLPAPAPKPQKNESKPIIPVEPIVNPIVESGKTTQEANQEEPSREEKTEEVVSEETVTEDNKEETRETNHTGEEESPDKEVIAEATVEVAEEEIKVEEAFVVSEKAEIAEDPEEEIKADEEEWTITDEEEIEEEEGEETIEQFGYQRTYYFRDYMLQPSDPEWWAQSAKEEVVIPFGIHINRDKILNREEIWSFNFVTKDLSKNGAFVLGASGSGKTNFLRGFIMSAAQRYSPKELEFYLIDFKSTGFEPFERYRLPHVKVVANHADREFGLNILKKLVDEQARRMRMRDRNESYPRTILIIDECQDFFPRTNDYNSDDDIVAQEATSILEFLLKKGREFNINIIIATQELASKTSQIPETLYKNMAIRYIASPKEDDYGEMFKRSENEAMAIKRDYGKGEALFVTNTYMNPECSYDEYHTKAFWIENNELDELITQLANYAAQHKDQCPTDMDLFVFHNDADLVDFNAQRRMLKEHLAAAQQAPESIPMYLGQPIAMENDVYLSLATTKVKKQNVLIVGSVPTDAPIGQSIAYNALLSSTKAYPTDQEHRTLDRVDYVFDFTQNGDSFEISGPPFSLESELIDNDEDAVKAKLTEINEELEIRKDDKTRLTPHIFLTFLGFERGDMFEAEEEASELLNTILEKGSKYGIFTIIQTVSDESSLQEQLGFEWQKHFNHVVALQMDSDTSCTLIKSRSAASLYKPLEVDINHGLYRALYFNAYSNTITKFKPYKF